MKKALIILGAVAIIEEAWLASLIIRARNRLAATELIEQQAEEDLGRIVKLYIDTRRQVEAESDDEGRT